MEESNLEESVRVRLIIAGLDELHEHGVGDFSLRRVAIKAQVSCAAPYRHFKDKGELIGAIIEYIASKWKLLCHEIKSAFADDKKRLVTELCVAFLRFWVANGSFRSVLMTADKSFAESLGEFDKPIDEAITLYFKSKAHKSDSEAADLQPLSAQIQDEIDECIYTVHTLIYGTLLLISQGRLVQTQDIIERVKNKTDALLSAKTV